MSLTIGRIGLDATIRTPAKWDQAGDVISLAGEVYATTTAAAAAIRQQVAALAANEVGTVVPVTWDQDPTIDGYYRVRGAAIGSTPVSMASNVWPFTAELERIAGGWRAGSFESMVAAAWVENAAGRAIDNAKPWVAVPATVTALDQDTTTIWHNADHADGVALVELPQVVAPLYARWSVAPADYYIGAARLVDDASGLAVVGVNTATVDPFGWTLSNGSLECRVTADASDLGHSAPGRIAIRHRLASSWTGWKFWNLDYYLRVLSGHDSVLASASSVRIIRNTPAEVTIRLSGTQYPTDVTEDRHHLAADISLRRGANYVSVVFNGTRPGAWWLYRSGGGEAASTSGLEGGTEGLMQAAAADGDGVTYAAVSPNAWTINDTNGTATLNSVSRTRQVAGIGGVVAAKSTATTEDPTRLADRYLTAQAETVQAIAW